MEKGEIGCVFGVLCKGEIKDLDKKRVYHLKNVPLDFNVKGYFQIQKSIRRWILLRVFVVERYE